MTVEGPFTPIQDPRPHDVAWPEMRWPPAVDRLTGDLVELTAYVPRVDVEPLFRALDHDAVWAHIAGRRADPARYEEVLQGLLAQGRFVWIVRLRSPYRGLAAGAVVGMSSYLDVSVHDARLEVGGTAYTPAVWASKVNPETKLLLLGYAFDTLGVGRVQLKTDVRNHRSQVAIARLGARYEGTLRRSMRRDDGTVRDSVFFSILAEEWPAVREGLRARLAE